MKIVTYNVQWFKGLDNVVDIARVLNVAREMADFDALCLQEIAVNYISLTGNLQPDQPAIVKQLLPGFEVFFSPAIDELSPCGTMRHALRTTKKLARHDDVRAHTLTRKTKM